MKHHFWVLIILLFISACTSVEFVRKETSPERKGLIRHFPTTDQEKAAEYRVKVNKAANDFCGGEFNISREFQAREESGSGVGTGVGFGSGGGSIFLGGSNRGSTMYNYVEIICR